jgi:hypothetical protein
MGTAALVASVAAALYFMATGVKPKKKDTAPAAADAKNASPPEPAANPHPELIAK